MRPQYIMYLLIKLTAFEICHHGKQITKANARFPFETEQYMLTILKDYPLHTITQKVLKNKSKINNTDNDDIKTVCNEKNKENQKRQH